MDERSKPPASRDAPVRPTRSLPRIAGIVNLSEDSFSDGGRYIDPAQAIARAQDLVAAGADLIDLGPASTRPGAKPVPAGEEIRRLEPVVDRLLAEGVTLSIDTFQPATQLWALERGVDLLNDIQGFPHPEIYSALAQSACRLVAMHSVQRLGPATRIRALEDAGVRRERLILDPGMGFFLGRQPEVSLEVLRRLGELRRRHGLPVWVCVSRKSFLGQLTGRAVLARGPATLAAELFAALQGADYIRTHEVAPLRDALVIWGALEAGTST